MNGSPGPVIGSLTWSGSQKECAEHGKQAYNVVRRDFFQPMGFNGAKIAEFGITRQRLFTVTAAGFNLHGRSRIGAQLGVGQWFAKNAVFIFRRYRQRHYVQDAVRLGVPEQLQTAPARVMGVWTPSPNQEFGWRGHSAYARKPGFVCSCPFH